MRKLVFAVYDAKVGAYSEQPFFARSRGEAVREWEKLANDGQSMMSQHPGDFTLFEVGEYDPATGAVKAHEAKVGLGTALEAKRPPTEQLSLVR